MNVPAILEQPWAMLSSGMIWWNETKLLVERASPVSNDALHVLVGVALWLLIALILRKSIAAAAPVLILLGLLACNEVVDLWVEQWPDAMMQYGESAKDLLLTLAIPVALMGLARLRPQLFSPLRPSRRGPGARSR